MVIEANTMKKTVLMVLLMMVVGSLFVIAQNDTTDLCSGFWRSLSCFLFGAPREREAVAGW